MMNSILTALANLATFSGGFTDRKPIRRPSINVQAASKPNRLATSWKFSTTFDAFRLVRSNSIKSSQISFSAGKNACRTRGLVICGVSFVRRLCQISPCLKTINKFCIFEKNRSETFSTHSFVIPVLAYLSGRFFR